MNWKIFLYIVAILLMLVCVGGLGYVITRPTTTQKADRIENKTINTEPPKVPIIGCSMWRINAKVYWENARKN